MEDTKLQTLSTFLGTQAQKIEATLNRNQNYKTIMNHYRYETAIEWARGELSDNEADTKYLQLSEVGAINWFINNLPRKLMLMDKDEVSKLLVEGVLISEIEEMNEAKYSHVELDIESDLVQKGE